LLNGPMALSADVKLAGGVRKSLLKNMALKWLAGRNRESAQGWF
jgi:hypothetical protein